jgi:hypothetical protein
MSMLPYLTVVHGSPPFPPPPQHTEPLDVAGVNEYIATLKAMGAADPQGIDDETLASLLAGEVPEPAVEGPGVELGAAPALPAGIAALVAQQVRGVVAALSDDCGECQHNVTRVLAGGW